MAAEIKPTKRSHDDRFSSVRKLELLSKLEGSGDDINAAIFIPGENGVISVADDKTIRVWLKRDSGQYWPSICESLPSGCTSIFYNASDRQLFIGQDNGTVTQYTFSVDCNRISFVRDYLAHQARVQQVVFANMLKWILSCGKDKLFVYYSTETGIRLGSYSFETPCTSLQFDNMAKYAFVGNCNGVITMLRCDNHGVQFINTFKGHSTSIRSLKWVEDHQLLFSGSCDQTIFVWDVGGKRGTIYELQGHRRYGDYSTCRLCCERHSLRYCPAFMAMTPEQRYESVRAHKYCINCLATSHATAACNSRDSCHRCGLAHHTLIHRQQHHDVGKVTKKRQRRQASKPEKQSTQRQVVITKPKERRQKPENNQRRLRNLFSKAVNTLAGMQELLLPPSEQAGRHVGDMSSNLIEF